MAFRSFQVSGSKFQVSGGCRATFMASRYERYFERPWLSEAARQFLFGEENGSTPKKNEGDNGGSTTNPGTDDNTINDGNNPGGTGGNNGGSTGGNGGNDGDGSQDSE